MTAFESDSFMGRSSGRMPERPVYCASCRHEHGAPVAWAPSEPCPYLRVLPVADGHGSGFNDRMAWQPAPQVSRVGRSCA